LCYAQNMKDKKDNVESFALFAKNYQQYKKNTLQYQQRVEYVKSLYEVWSTKRCILT
jgi:hypothetical protein